MHTLHMLTAQGMMSNSLDHSWGGTRHLQTWRRKPSLGLERLEGLVKRSGKKFWNYPFTYPRNTHNSLSKIGVEMQVPLLELSIHFCASGRDEDKRGTIVPALWGVSTFRAQGRVTFMLIFFYSLFFYICFFSKLRIRNQLLSVPSTTSTT